jgi:hypothetical protein
MSTVKNSHTKENLIKEVAFFGEEIPVGIFPTIDISQLIDNQHNRSPGYSFIDDPRNNFDQYRQAYGRWFLSDPKRAEMFVHSDGSNLTWLPGPTQVFLKDMETCRDLLAAGTVMSGGPSGRATEVARRIFREMTGAERNLRILYHNLCLTDINDKTMFKSMNEKFIPHVPTREYSTALIINGQREKAMPFPCGPCTTVPLPCRVYHAGAVQFRD